MHVLLVNDDGPPNNIYSPYIKGLVDELRRSTDWKISIVIPEKQRSWISKAHFINKKITCKYIYTKIDSDHENSYYGPFESPQKNMEEEYIEWCLVNGTPATCVDLGIHHIHKDKDQKVQLVLSGPNFGKNTGSIYMLASGTIGASIESATHNVKSIALSYSYESEEQSYKIIKEANKISVRLIKHLYNEFQKNDVDFFSINVPLNNFLSLHKTEIYYAPVLKNTWKSIYTNVVEKNGENAYIWNPDYEKVNEDEKNSLHHSDARILLNNSISVTPLKAEYRTNKSLLGKISLH